MSVVAFRDGEGNTRYMLASGNGMSGDPYVLDQRVSLNTNNAGGDAFGRVRVSSPATIFDSKQVLGNGVGTFWDEETFGTGSIVYDGTESCSDMAVTTTNDFAIRQTKQHFNYQPGKSQRIFCTGILNPQTGTTKLVGPIQGSTTTPFTVSDGICFETIGTDMYCSIYKGGTPTRVIQGSWNVDKLDGTGPSGITVDWTKAQIFTFDYEWLGVGRVRFSLNIDGMEIIVHEVLNANNVTNVYMRSGNQPIRYEIRSTGSAGTLKAICCSIQSEGGQEATGLVRSFDTGPTTLSISSTMELVMAIRLKSTALDANVVIEKLSMLTTSNSNFRWSLIFNPVITGTPAWTSISNYSLEVWYGTGAETLTEPFKMDGGFVSNDASDIDVPTRTNIALGSDINGTSDIIALGAQLVGGGSMNLVGGMTVRQLV